MNAFAVPLACGPRRECDASRSSVRATRSSRSTKALGRFVTGPRRGRRDVPGEKEIFEISARGRKIGASGNHPFLILRDEREPGATRARYAARWVRAEELRPGDFVAVPTDLPEFGEPAELHVPDRPGAEPIPDHDRDDLCWWLGIYLGDGYLQHSGGHTTVEIAVDRTDGGLVDEIRRVGAGAARPRVRLVAKDGLRLTAKGTSSLASFIELNGLGGTSHTKRIPDWVFGLPRSQRLALLAGLLDSDGYVRDHPTSKDAMYCSANEGLLGDVRELVALCGIGSSSVISVSNKHPFDRERIMQAYHLRLSGAFRPDPGPFARAAASDIGRRKYWHRYRTAQGHRFPAPHERHAGLRADRLDSSRVGLEPVYDIEVEGHHNFVADGFVVHNSEVVFHRNREDLEQQGVLFCDMDTAVREHPDSSASGSARSSRRTTTSSPRSTRRSGRAGLSSTCRPASTWRCRFRRISGSTPRTWASSSGR